MSLRLFARFLLSSACVVLAGCKTRESSDLNEFEKAGYAGKDICVLIKDEASRHVKERGQTFEDAYREVFNREAGIFTLLVPKARICAGNRAPVEDKPGSTPPPGATASTGAEGATNAQEIDAAAQYPAAQDPECEGLADGSRLADFEAKELQLKSCDPATTKITDPNAAAKGTETMTATSTAKDPVTGEPTNGVEPTADERKLQQDQSALSLTGEVEIKSEFCNLFGLDSGECNALVQTGIAGSRAGLDKLCRGVGKLLKDQKPGRYDSQAAIECGAEVVTDICARHVTIAKEAADAANDGSRRLNAKVQDIFDASVKAMSRSFTSSIVKCVAAYGKEKAKDVVQNAVEDQAKSWLSKKIGKAEEMLKNDKRRALAGAACAVAGGIADATMGKYESKDVSAECKDVWKWDKARFQACTQSVRDIGCDAIVTGKIDLAESFHVDDKDQAGRLFAELTSGVLEGTCAGAGRVGSASCAIIAKAGGYIFDAFKGKSNPWADCLGTPAMGTCVGEYWHYWSTGIKTDDYKVGVADSKKAGDEKFYNDVCWCWRKCMSDDWGTDREVHKALYWEMATKGDAGLRFCASKERELKWPVGLTWENGRRNVYIQYTSCGVSRARGPDTNLWDDKGYMEILADGKWGWYQFPRGDGYMGCGGRADGGT